MSIQRIVAVVGCQRSGTTLTGQILGAHPAAVLLDEPDGVYKWFRAEAARDANTQDYYHSMLGRAEKKYRDAAGRFVLGAEKVDLLPHVTTLILKVPSLTYDHEDLQNFPLPVSIVNPVRDPRSVVASMMRLRSIDFVDQEVRQIDMRRWTAAAFGHERSILASEDEPLWVRCATLWKIKSGRAPHYRQLGLPAFQFRYEDLVQSKETVVAEILAHCGLDPANEVLRPQTVYVGRGPGGTERTRPIDEDSLESWSIYLDEAKEADVLRICNPLAKIMGYT